MSAHNHTDQAVRDNGLLTRVVEHLGHAVEDAGRVSSADELENDRILFNSVAMELTQAQEAARGLSESFRHAHPELPWRQLRALRNVIVHEHDGIDVDMLYATATIDAADLLSELHLFVDSLDG